MNILVRVISDAHEGFFDEEISLPKIPDVNSLFEGSAFTAETQVRIRELYQIGPDRDFFMMVDEISIMDINKEKTKVYHCSPSYSKSRING